MNKKLLSFLGIAKRANKLVFGNDAVIESINKGLAKLLILTDDISDNTSKKLLKIAGENKTEVLTADFKKDDVFKFLKKYSAVISVTDEGFANKIRLLNAQYNISFQGEDECNEI